MFQFTKQKYMKTIAVVVRNHKNDIPNCRLQWGLDLFGEFYFDVILKVSYLTKSENLSGTVSMYGTAL